MGDENTVKPGNLHEEDGDVSEPGLGINEIITQRRNTMNRVLLLFPIILVAALTQSGSQSGAAYKNYSPLPHAKLGTQLPYFTIAQKKIRKFDCYEDYKWRQRQCDREHKRPSAAHDQCIDICYGNYEWCGVCNGHC